MNHSLETESFTHLWSFMLTSVFLQHSTENLSHIRAEYSFQLLQDINKRRWQTKYCSMCQRKGVRSNLHAAENFLRQSLPTRMEAQLHWERIYKCQATAIDDSLTQARRTSTSCCHTTQQWHSLLYTEWSIQPAATSLFLTCLYDTDKSCRSVPPTDMILKGTNCMSRAPVELL